MRAYNAVFLGHDVFRAKGPVVSRTVMQISVSAIVLVAAIYIIVSTQYDAKDKHWAYGAVGTILG
jgi:hypothetical protein